ncbi:hypothetical protein BB561_001930 [Smittium simulii]|uniref:TPX2 C-terminal domain-containing protein n=1 Tax=Smittium simulii TaxID=133385 RepID=A0A2T9YSJ6_9FUNG|nr:hypothetical protein BB561_001930 [Smittium simulii]
MNTPETSKRESDSFWDFEVPKNFDFQNTPGPKVDEWFDKRKDTPWKRDSKIRDSFSYLSDVSQDGIDFEFSDYEEEHPSTKSNTNEEKGLTCSIPLIQKQANGRKTVNFNVSEDASSKKQHKKRLSLTPHSKKKTLDFFYNPTSNKPRRMSATGSTKPSAWIIKTTPVKTDSIEDSTINSKINFSQVTESDADALLYERNVGSGATFLTSVDSNSKTSNKNTITTLKKPNTQIPSIQKSALKSAFKVNGSKSTIKKKVGFGNNLSESDVSIELDDSDKFNNNTTESSSSLFNSFISKLELLKTKDKESEITSSTNLGKRKLQLDGEHENVLDTYNHKSINTLNAKNVKQTSKQTGQKKLKLTRPLNFEFMTDKRLSRLKKIQKTGNNTNIQNSGKEQTESGSEYNIINRSKAGTKERKGKTLSSTRTDNAKDSSNSKTNFARQVAHIGSKWVIKNKKQLTTTVPKPFKFHTDMFAERKLARLREAIEKIEKFEKEQRNFKAQPLPYFNKTKAVEPVIERKSPTKPLNFKLQTDFRSESYRLELEKKLEKFEQNRKERANFKANTIPITHDYPFIPDRSQKSPTNVENIVLHTELRHETREAWEEGLFERMENKKKILEKLELEAIEIEKREIRELRARLVHNPLPIPSYEPLQIYASDKPPTIPISPKWAPRSKQELTG